VCDVFATVTSKDIVGKIHGALAFEAAISVRRLSRSENSRSSPSSSVIDALVDDGGAAVLVPHEEGVTLRAVCPWIAGRDERRRFRVLCVREIDSGVIARYRLRILPQLDRDE